MPTNVVDIVAEQEKLREALEDNTKAFEKSNAKKLSTVYAIIMRILSIALFAGAVVAGLYGFGFSTLVLGSMFMLFWFIDRLAAAIVFGFKNYADGKVADLEAQVEQRVHATEVLSNIKAH